MIKRLSSAALSAAMIATFALAAPASANDLPASYGVSVVDKDATALSFNKEPGGFAPAGTVSRNVVQPSDYARGRFHETRAQRVERQRQPDLPRPSLRQGLYPISR